MGQNFHTRESLQGPLWDKTVTHWGPSKPLDARYSDIENTYLNKHKSKYCYMNLLLGPLWDKAVTHTGVLPTFWNVTWLCWDQMNLSRHTMVTSRLDLNWLKLSTVWVDRRPFQLDPAVPLWFCQQVSIAWNYKNVHLFEFKFIWPKNMLFKSVILIMWLAGHLAWDNQDRIMLRFAAYFTQHNWRD